MKNQTIGAELEFTGLTRRAAARVIAEIFDTTVYQVGMNGWAAEDDAGREWKVVYDSSIRRDDGEQCELVTPILGWADIETLQMIVRELRHDGAKVNDSCGLHVHIGAAGMTAQAVRNLVNNFASHEALLIKALDVHENRKRYCKPLNENFIRELNQRKPATLDGVGEIWYQRPAGTFPTYHYHESRYQTLNLHALFTKGTAEFRFFNGTLHAGEVKTAVQLACALVANAKSAKRTLYRPIETDNDRFAMRTWLNRLGLIGDEFKTARLHLTKRLEGNAAWRHAV